MFPAVSPTAKSLILDLLSTLRRGTMPVQALVEAGGLFGIAENSTRVTLTRLTAARTVERDARGRYRLSAEPGPVGRRATSWRSRERGLRRWNGDWLGVLDGPRQPGAGRAERSRRQRALGLLGFAPLTPALAVRPDNLPLRVDAIRAELHALGLAPGHLVIALRDLDPVTDARARRAWDGDAIRAEHRAMLSRIEQSSLALPHQTVERAMVDSFLLGGRAIRQLILDPQLPDELVPGDERRALLEAMRDYDRLGRRAWAPFLERFAVPHLRAPADTRMSAGASRLAP